LHYKLSYRDLLDMMAERGLKVAHTTNMHWTQRYVPALKKCWNRTARKAGRSWHSDAVPFGACFNQLHHRARHAMGIEPV